MLWLVLLLIAGTLRTLEYWRNSSVSPELRGEAHLSNFETFSKNSHNTCWKDGPFPARALLTSAASMPSLDSSLAICTSPKIGADMIHYCLVLPDARARHLYLCPAEAALFLKPGQRSTLSSMLEKAILTLQLRRRKLLARVSFVTCVKLRCDGLSFRETLLEIRTTHSTLFACARQTCSQPQEYQVIFSYSCCCRNRTSSHSRAVLAPSQRRIVYGIVIDEGKRTMQSTRDK